MPVVVQHAILGPFWRCGLSSGELGAGGEPDPGVLRLNTVVSEVSFYACVDRPQVSSSSRVALRWDWWTGVRPAQQTAKAAARGE